MLGKARHSSRAAGLHHSPNTYPCADGQYVIIAGNGDAIFKRLMRAIGRDDLGDDPDLEHNDGRVRQNDKLDAAIAAWTMQHDLEHVLVVLDKAAVPNGRVYTAEDISKDPHYKARNMIERFELPDGQPIDLPGIVPKLSETPGRTNWVGPKLGEHTDEVLASVGIGADELKRMRSFGII